MAVTHIGADFGRPPLHSFGHGAADLVPVIVERFVLGHVGLLSVDLIGSGVVSVLVAGESGDGRRSSGPILLVGPR